MLKPFLILFAGLFFLSSCSHTPVHPAGAPSTSSKAVEKDGVFEVIQMTENFKVKRAILKNGLKLMILKDTSSPTFAYQTWFNVGSRNEVNGKTGLAHLFEHLMFKGTKNHAEGQFDALLEQAGAEDENAFTTNDHTVYVQELPKKALDLIIGLEADRMVNLIVNDASFKTEREVVQNERRFRKENSAEGTIYQTLFETAFTDSALHWPVIGYEQDLNLMSAQDARNFYERYYTPNRATIVVVGDVDEDEVYRKVNQAYGSIENKGPVEEPVSAEPEQTAQRRKKLSLNVEVEKLWMAYKIPNGKSPDAPVLDAIQAVLTDGKNSRLNRALVDAGIAGSVSAGSLSLRDPGLFLFETDLQKGKSSLVAESIIQQEITKLKTTPVKPEELKRAVSVMKFNFFQRLTQTKERAEYIGRGETELGSLEAALAQQKQLEQVTPEQITEVMNKYFDTSKLTVITAVPKKAN